MKRIFYMGNNRLGWEVCRWLVESGEPIVGAALHPPQRRKYGEEITGCLPPGAPVFPADRLHEPEIMEEISALGADLGVSVLFGYILRKPFLEIFPHGCINLHPALLPYNRGSYPNVWSIVEGTPAGSTIHFIDAGIDTGDIVAQREVAVEPVDTGETLYGKLERASLELFRDTWPLIKAGETTARPQSPDSGTSHRLKDIGKIDEIKLEKSYRARDLINILRARTYPPYKGAYFEEGGRKVYLRLQLEYEEDE